MQRSHATISLRDRKLCIEFDQVLGLQDAITQYVSTYNTEHSLESDNLVHSLFESQAKKTPDSIAVQFEDQDRLTYQQLNETANAVARQLPWARGTIVPIAISRSTNLIIALLAILKAGASYVLLSTDSPLERNRFIVKDTNASLVIVDSDSRGWFEDVDEVSIEDLVNESHTMSKKHRSDLNNYQEASEVAYVIYTSGTTGRPKGVVLSHAAAYTGLSALAPLDASQSFRQLLCHSPNFSAAQRTILGTLCRGGTLCLASKENITLGLHDTIEKMGISSLEITPSMLRLIDPLTVPVSIKKITLGGEAVSPELVEAWAGRVELISAYGLSECTQVWSSSLHPVEN